LTENWASQRCKIVGLFYLPKSGCKKALPFLAGLFLNPESLLFIATLS
jgi:hypothetical protein